MSITVDFSVLWRCVEQMGAEQVEGSIYTPKPKSLDFDLDVELGRGKEISLNDLEVTSGLLSVEGRQVLLYIADHGNSVTDVIAGEKDGRRFHVADCSTLESMRQKNRFDRYHVTNDLTSNFKIFGVNATTRLKVDGSAELHVCKNCLKFLNYKGYRSNRSAVFRDFQIKEFFSRYSSLFKHYPRQFEKSHDGYTEGWAKVSRAYRTQKDFTCEHCGLDLNEYNNLLHCHHVNGVKSNNSEENLRALCIDCHRKEPLHDWMKVKYQDMQTINRLRIQQGIIARQDWDRAIELGDTALEGLLRCYRDKDYVVPEIGYELFDSASKLIATLDLAWSEQKLCVLINTENTIAIEGLGWEVTSLEDAIREEN